MKPKLYIATPAYDGKVFVDYCTSLISTLQILDKAGVAYELGIENGDCYVAKARNKLARKFLETDCTHLLFIDADVGWEVDNIPNILIQDRDICLGVYPMKDKEGTFPIQLIMDEKGKLVNDGLNIQIEMGPTGFMCIKRKVFETLRENHPKLEYQADPETNEWNFFHCHIMDNKWWGEDFDFCRKAVREGFKIWCYTDITFRHWGINKWSANCKQRLDENRSQ